MKIAAIILIGVWLSGCGILKGDIMILSLLCQGQQQTGQCKP